MLMPNTLMLVFAFLALTALYEPTLRNYRQGFNGKDAAEMNDTNYMAGRPQARSRTQAKAKITVRSSEVHAYDQTGGPELADLRLNETFAGDIEGESTVRALEVRRNNQSASLVSIQRFSGTLGGRRGTFVLQGTELIEKGKIKATWFVVPGSGTGGLSGLRGDGGFEGDFGKGSEGRLDYWFE